MPESWKDIRITQVPAWRQPHDLAGVQGPGTRLELYALRETPEIATALEVMARRHITVVIVPLLINGRDSEGKPLYVAVELRNGKQERFRWVGDVPNVDREVNESIRVLLTDIGAIYKELVN
jgi:hypothetical protein